MALFAQIKFTQDGAPGNAGEAFLGAPTLPVTTEQDPGEESSDLIGSWVMTLLNAPAASGYSTLTPLELGSADTDTPITSSLVPDVPGSYRVRLRIWGLAGQVGTSSTDIRNFIVPEPKHGFVVPPYQQDPLPLPTIASGSATAKPNETNIGGNEYGWMGDGTDGLVATAIKKLDASNFDIVPDPTTTGDVLTATAGFANCNVPSDVVLHGDSAWFCNTGIGFVLSNPGGGVTRVSKTTQKITERLGLGDGGGTIARIPTFVVSAGLRLFLIYLETDSTTYSTIFAHEILVGAPGSSSFGTAYLIWTEATPEQVTPSGAVYDAANDIIWVALRRVIGTSFVIGVSVPFMVVGTPVTIAGAAEPIFDLILDTDTSHYGDVAQRLYTVDLVNGRVVRIKNLATTPTLDGFFVSGVPAKGALLTIGGGAAGSGGGRIYVCDFLGGLISSFNTAGTLLIGPVVIGVPVFTVTYEATNDSLIVAALATNQVQIGAFDASDLATPLATPILLPPTDEATGPGFIFRYIVHSGYLWAYSPSTDSIFGAFEPAGHIYRIDSIGLTNVVELLTVGTAAWAPGGGGGGLPGFEDIPTSNLGGGALTLGSLTSGTENVAVGPSACFSATTASSNTAVGAHVLQSLTTGSGNVGVGANALDVAVGASDNTVVGFAAMGNAIGASSNAAFGTLCLSALVSGSENTAIGYQALVAHLGSDATAVGSLALFNNTTGIQNTAVGWHALEFNVTTSQNTAVGYKALLSCTASRNTAVGNEAASAVTTGVSNTAVGAQALNFCTTGNNNTAVGDSALTLNVSGVQNVAVGVSAAQNTTGSSNTAVGFNARKFATSGTNNTVVGHSAMGSGASTASDNTAVGQLALQSSTSGNENTAVGASAAKALTSGASNVAVGFTSLSNCTTGGSNTAVGRLTLFGCTAGGQNTAIGDTALGGLTSAGQNVGVGANAGAGITTGNSNVAVGAATLAVSAGATELVAVGYAALNACTGSSNTAVGFSALAANTTVGQLTAVGAGALTTNTTGLRNVAVGYHAMNALGNGSDNVAIGHDALSTTFSGTSNVAVGSSAMVLCTGNQNVSIGDHALAAATAVDFCVAVGANALANSTGSYNTAVGGSVMYSNTTGVKNTAVGVQALNANTNTDNNVAVGYHAASLATGTRNTVVGMEAFNAATSAADNVAFGYQAANLSTGADNVCIGSSVAGALSTGAGNVIIGKSAGATLTTGGSNVLIADDVPAAGTSNHLGIGSGTISGDVSTKQITFRRITTAGITASTTQTQGNGALTSDVNQISVCAADKNTVTLPPALAGLEVIVTNDGAKTLQVFPASGDDLGLGVNVATLQFTGGTTRYVSRDSTNWKAFREPTDWTAEGAWAVPFVCWPFNSYTSGGGNTSTGTVTAFGTPVSTTPATYGVVITTGGIQGTAIFSLTSTIAATITGITVPAGAGVYVVPGTGISILFGAGTYVVTNTWGWNTVFAAIGDGSLTGHYRVVGDSIDLRLVFTMGTTTDLGGGVGTPTSQGIIIPTPPASVVDGDKLPLLAVSGGVSIKAIQLLVSIGTGVGNTVGLLQFVYKYSAFSQAVVDTDTLSSLAPGNFAMIQMADVPIKHD
jgi:hypothetical protein